MRRTLPLLVLAGLAAPAAAQSPARPADPTPAAKPVVVPFELLASRHMAVQVMVNGKGPYRLIFDTGAPMNLVTNRLAKDAGVIDPAAKKGGFGLFGMAGQHTAKTLKVGTVEVEKMPVMVMDHPTVAALAAALDQPLDGIVGFPFFARYAMTVDYQKRELTLVPNGYVPGDYLTGLMGKLMAAQNQKPEPTVVAPAGLWGLTADKEAGDEADGVVVTAVAKGGAAAAGGLKPGDRVLTVGGRWTDTVGDLYRAAADAKPGASVPVVVARGKKELKLSVTPARGF